MKLRSTGSRTPRTHSLLDAFADGEKAAAGIASPPNAESDALPGVHPVIATAGPGATGL